MIRKFQTHDGLTLAFRDEGEGLPLLCLAGLTRNSLDFDYLAPHLSDVRLIRLDYRGRGKSEWADPSTYTVPVEAQDVLALLDHLDVKAAAVLGTSRGGLIAMTLAVFSKHRLLGVCLNDIGPVIEKDGLEEIRSYIGKKPPSVSFHELAMSSARRMSGFENVPVDRWRDEATRRYTVTGTGIIINYDPDLARIFDDPPDGSPVPTPDFWPMFDALEDLPLALIRGVNSNLLSRATATEMGRRRPDMIHAEVPDRGHVPFLDEPESLDAIHAWLAKIT